MLIVNVAILDTNNIAEPTTRLTIGLSAILFSQYVPI